MDSNNHPCFVEGSESALGSEHAEDSSTTSGLALALAPVAEAPETADVTRGQERWQRKRQVRARTISMKRLTKRQIEIGRLQYPEMVYERPRSRSECVNAPRPCPYVSCKHHLYLDVARSGGIKLNFPDIEVDEMTETCSLDVADRGGATLEEVGAIMNLTRERIRQVEMEALATLLEFKDMLALHDYVDEASTGKRRLPTLPERELPNRAHDEQEDAAVEPQGERATTA